MQPTDVVHAWVHAFNRAVVEALTKSYSSDAINQQIAESPAEGHEVIRKMFIAAFATADMVCIVENIFQDGEWAILKWRDPKEL
jgi:ketosteroid isomerase-like protein